MSMTVSVRMQGLGGVKHGMQTRHDLRSGKMPSNVDPGRTHLNSRIIVPPSAQALQKSQAEIRKAKGKQTLRHDARISYSGIITWGTEAQVIIRSLSPEMQDRLYKEIARRIAEEHYRTRLIGLVVHRDESANHAHFMLSGLDRNGVALRPKASDGVKIQNIAGQVLKDLGYGQITRGTPKAERVARGDSKASTVHRSVKQLHDDLPQEIDLLMKKRERYAQQVALFDVISPDVVRPQIPSLPDTILIEQVMKDGFFGKKTKKVSVYVPAQIREYRDHVVGIINDLCETVNTQLQMLRHKEILETEETETEETEEVKQKIEEKIEKEEHAEIEEGEEIEEDHSGPGF